MKSKKSLHLKTRSLHTPNNHKIITIKGQALALVLVIIAVSIIVVLALTNRVLTDMKQQTQERIATRTETLADSAVDKITQMLDSGDLPLTGAETQRFISVDPEGGSDPNYLGLCSPDEEDVNKRCDATSQATIVGYKGIFQFKLFNGESFEIPLTANKDDSPIAEEESKVLIHLKTANQNFNIDNSAFLIKSYQRKEIKGNREVVLNGECVWKLNTTTNQKAQCIPKDSNGNDFTIEATVVTCPQITIEGADEPIVLGDTCLEVQGLNDYPVSFYRIKPLLAGNVDNVVPFIEMSTTGAKSENQYQLNLYHMAIIKVGVYSSQPGTEQVFQQKTRVYLPNLIVPEIADYVLYNGSDRPISK